MVLVLKLRGKDFLIYSIFREFESVDYYAPEKLELVLKLRARSTGEYSREAILLRQAQVWLGMIPRALCNTFTHSLFIQVEESNKPGKFSLELVASSVILFS